MGSETERGAIHPGASGAPGALRPGWDRLGSCVSYHFPRGLLTQSGPRTLGPLLPRKPRLMEIRQQSRQRVTFLRCRGSIHTFPPSDSLAGWEKQLPGPEFRCPWAFGIHGGTRVASEPMVQERVELKMQKLSLPLPLGFQTLPTVLEAQALHLPPGQVYPGR